MLRMLDRVVLLTNLVKANAMVSTPGFIWVQQGTEEYKSIATVKGAMFCKGKKAG